MSPSGKTTDANRALKSFYASLAPMRSAISSNARETGEDLNLSLPGFKDCEYYSRGELQHLIEHLLANPGTRLTAQVRQQAHASFLDQSLPDPSVSSPRPRM